MRVMKFFTPKLLPVAITLISGQVSAAALEEVVVTAQRRTESLMDVPISIAAMSGEKLNEAGITRMADLVAYVPNLTMTEAAIGSNIYIRGVGSQVNQGFEQSVGTYVDGIYYGRPRQLRAPFFDLERVEVLRGPQAILFGKNSIGGALSLTTAKPSDEFEGDVSLYYEPDHEELETYATLSGPLSDSLRGRLSLRKRDMDGYLDNIAKDSYEMETDEWVVRGTLVWDATDSLAVTFKAETGEFNTKGRNLVILNDPAPGGATPIVNEFEKKAVNDEEYSDNEYDNYTLTLDYQMGDFTLTSITGYSAYEYQEAVDTDFGIGSTVQTPSSEDFDQFSQELRLVSPQGQTFDYIVGLFYQTNDISYREPAAITLPAIQVILDRDYGSESDAWAVFGQGTWNATETFRITLGARYTEESKDGFRRLPVRNVDGSIFNPLNLPEFAELGMPLPGLGVVPHDLRGDRDEQSFTPMINVQWDVGSDAMLYASASTGFKAGGFDARSNRAALPDGSPALEFEEEEALAFEVGGKLQLLDGAAELNIALFRTEFDDLQVSVFDGVLGFDVANAAEAVSQGVELDGRWQATDHLMFSGAVGYTDFEFENYPDGACYKGQTPDRVESGVPFCDWSGNTNQLTPEFSATVSADFVYPVWGNLELRATLDVIYSDEYFAAPDLDPNLVQDSFTKINARLGIGSVDGTWDVALVGKNLTDEEIISFGNDVPLTGPVQSYFAFVERPATVAIQGRYRF